jgi:hypothetical protein
VSPILAGLLSAVTILVALVLAARRPTPVLPTALLAVASPVLAYTLYYEPIAGVLLALVLIVGLGGGVTLQRRVAQVGAPWADRMRLPLILQATWSAAYVWQQFAELGHSSAVFRIAVALFALTGGVWAGYLLAGRFSKPAGIPSRS